MFSRAAWARVLPFAIYLSFIFVSDMLGRAGVGADWLRWLYPVKIAAVALALVVFWGQYRELAAPRLGGAGAALLALAAGLLVLVLWVNLDAPWMVIGQSAGYDPRVDGKLLWPLVLIRIAGAALVVPIMEELFWRSFLMRWIVAPGFEAVRPADINIKSFIVTVILFGVEHNLWLAGMVAGAIYSLLYLRTGKLWVAILAHGVTNGALGIWIITTANWTYW
jgi:CAAX prenyl protease-like protein